MVDETDQLFNISINLHCKCNLIMFLIRKIMTEFLSYLSDFKMLICLNQLLTVNLRLTAVFLLFKRMINKPGVNFKVL